jgi:hypothetical protein
LRALVTGGHDIPEVPRPKARLPDLLVAAAAEASSVPVLRYDESYDRIAAITGQDVRWLAPRGSATAPTRSRRRSPMRRTRRG